MNWMFFRSLLALQKDHMQKNWKLLTSKINWMKQGVRSTTPLRISQMASVLYSFCYKWLSKHSSLLMNLPSEHKKMNIQRMPWIFLVVKLNSCPSSHANNLNFWAFFISFHYLAELSGASDQCALLSDKLPHALVEAQLCLLQSMALNKSWRQFFSLEMEGLV